MKGRIYTLLVLFATTLGWSSCSDEIPAGSDEGKDVMVNVSFDSGELKTKAGGTIGDASTIKNRFIAAFRGGECTGIASSPNAAEDMKIKAKVGTIHFLAVANANDVRGGVRDAIEAFNTNGTLPNYATLKQAIVEFGLSDTTSLVKVKDTTVVYSSYKDEEQGLKVVLTQLTARIDVHFAMKEGSQGSFLLKTYTIEGINESSNVFLDDKVTTANIGNKIDLYEAKPLSTGYVGSRDENKGFTFYSFEKNTEEKGAIVLTMTGILNDTKNNISDEKTYQLTLDPVISGASVTKGIVHGYNYVVTGEIDLKDPEMNLKVTVKPWTDAKPVDVNYGTSKEGNK